MTLLNITLGAISDSCGVDLLLRILNEGYIGRKEEKEMHRPVAYC